MEAHDILTLWMFDKNKKAEHTDIKQIFQLTF